MHQAIIWTNAGILSIWPLGTNFSEIFYRNSNIFVEENTFENVACEMVSILSRLQCVNKVAAILQMTFSKPFENFDILIQISLKFFDPEYKILTKSELWFM